MKKKLLSLLLAGVMLTSASVGFSAASTDAEEPLTDLVLAPLDNDLQAAETGMDTNVEIVAADYPQVGGVLEPEGELPSSYSSVDSGYVTGVRHQIYNTCWAYASTAV